MKFPRANRRITAGKHPLTKVFPGLDEDPAFGELFPDGTRQEVLDNQHGPLGVRLKAGTGEPDHRLGEVDAHLVAGAGLEHELADLARPAADVEHSRLRALADGVDGQVAAPHQPWPSSRTSGRSSS